MWQLIDSYPLDFAPPARMFWGKGAAMYPKLGPIDLNPPVILAPMAGITDLPFRRMVARFGAGLVVSEMVASEDMMRAQPLALARAELGLGEAATSVQLAGRDPHWMAEAARYLQGQGAQVIDINMGCPAKRVTASGGNGACGSALMKEPDLALRLIEAVSGAVSVPVTLKTRLGWDDASLNAPQIAKMAEGAGVRMITIHGRTRCQFYKGSANWSAIRAVKDAVAVPVIANGDIVDAKTAAQALSQSGADGVMIGRGAQGAPWRLAEIGHALFGQPAPQIPQGADLAAMIIEHYELILGFYGRELGLRVARKHLGWYLDEARLTAHRDAILTATDPQRVIRLISTAFCAQEEVAA
jgi:tRNA-dihydrouridine synthase B